MFFSQFSFIDRISRYFKSRMMRLSPEIPSLFLSLSLSLSCSHHSDEAGYDDTSFEDTFKPLRPSKRERERGSYYCIIGGYILFSPPPPSTILPYWLSSLWYNSPNNIRNSISTSHINWIGSQVSIYKFCNFALFSNDPWWHDTILPG